MEPVQHCHVGGASRSMVHSAKEKSVARIPEALDGDIMNKRPKRKIFKKKLVSSSYAVSRAVLYM